MKKASNIMFRIGNIFTVLYLVLGVILFLVGIGMAIAGTIGAAATGASAEEKAAAIALASAGGSMIGAGIYFFVTSLVCLILVRKAQRELANEATSNKKPFIVSIVCGAIASNYFYVLAGIFGIIAEGQQGRQAE